MKNTPSFNIWIHPAVKLIISIILFIELLNILCLIFYWNELDTLFQVVLISSAVLTPLYLSMYVTRLAFENEQLQFVLPHKIIPFTQTDIEYIRIRKKLNQEHIEIKLKKPIGIRKKVYVEVQKNLPELTELMNYFLQERFPIYTNSKLSTKIRLNPKTKRFEF